MREWPKFGRGLSPPTPSADADATAESGADGGSSPALLGRAVTAPRLLGRAVAGSVYSRLQEPAEGQSNAALGLTYADLQAQYRTSNREGELRYDPPDTSALVLQCKQSNAAPVP